MFMQKCILSSLIVLASVCFVCQSYSQGSLTPLYLFISGSGSITSLQDGQLLEVGTDYQMTAVPDTDFTFGSWQPVKVFVFTEVVRGLSGDLTAITSMTLIPIASYTSTASLAFTMQPEQVLLNVPSVGTITESSGWQANFVPIPEPSDGAFIIYGFTSFILFRYRHVFRLLRN